MSPNPPRNSGAALGLKGHHVAVRVPDFEGSKRWFVEKLDFRVVDEWSSGDLKLAYLAPATEDAFFVEIIGGGAPVARPGYADLDCSLQQAGFHHFCLNVKNVDHTVAELRRRGVMIVREAFKVEAIGRKLAFFADPWHNLFELAEILR